MLNTILNGCRQKKSVITNASKMNIERNKLSNLSVNFLLSWQPLCILTYSFFVYFSSVFLDSPFTSDEVHDRALCRVSEVTGLKMVGKRWSIVRVHQRKSNIWLAASNITLKGRNYLCSVFISLIWELNGETWHQEIRMKNVHSR